jgi:hypothetical protein
MSDFGRPQHRAVLLGADGSVATSVPVAVPAGRMAAFPGSGLTAPAGQDSGDGQGSAPGTGKAAVSGGSLTDAAAAPDGFRLTGTEIAGGRYRSSWPPARPRCGCWADGGERVVLTDDEPDQSSDYAIRWIDFIDCTLVTAGAESRLGRARSMAQARKITMYIVVIFILYTIIDQPARAADLVQVGFVGISNAAKAVGQFMHDLTN